MEVTFDGQDGYTWGAYIIGYRAPSASTESEITLNSNGYGTGLEPWPGNNHIVLVPVVSEWLVSAPNLTYTYNAVSVHMKSPSELATAYNNGRRIVRDGSNKYHVVFESGGEVYYTFSTDNGSTWADEVRLSSGNGNNKYPSITGTSSKQFVIWQRYTGYTGGQHRYDTYFAKNTGSGWITAKLNELSDLGFSSQTNPQPVITYTTNQQGLYRLLVCARTSSGIKYVASTNDGGTWSTATLIPDASSRHRNQSLSMGPTTPPVMTYFWLAIRMVNSFKLYYRIQGIQTTSGRLGGLT